MGTVVFPDAALKVFLTATAEERAERRYKQLNEKGIHANLRALSRDLAARDARDRARAVAPLKRAADAKALDCSSLPSTRWLKRFYSGGGRGSMARVPDFKG